MGRNPADERLGAERVQPEETEIEHDPGGSCFVHDVTRPGLLNPAEQRRLSSGKIGSGTTPYFATPKSCGVRLNPLSRQTLSSFFNVSTQIHVFQILTIVNIHFL